MDETKNILFASDLSTEMETVFKHAATTAVYQKAHIIVVHVMEENSRAEKRVKTAFGEQLYQNLKSEHREGARNILLGKNVDALRIQQAIAGFFQGGNNGDNDDTTSLISKILVTQGRSIADEITATAVEEGCNMIIMGCKQQSLLAKAIGDNLVRKILKRSTVPVLMVPFKKQESLY
jgi:nucleotide-binding universal stress UspA family protein